jgi:hypothetical protein
MEKKKREILHNRGRGGRTHKERMRLVKSHIPGNTHPASHRIPTKIILMLITIAEKNTLNRLSEEFGAFTRGKENVANATKQTKHKVVRRAIKEALKRNRTLKGGKAAY